MQQPSHTIESRSGCPVLLARSRQEGGGKRRQREGGYMLLAIMLMLAFVVVTLTYVVAPAIVQQLKRDREAEMIHRGTEYARAIKKFYKKNGRYPGNLDDLDKGQVRFLRKRYTDPLAKDGKWKLLHYGDIQLLLSASTPGIPAGALNQGGTTLPGGAVISGVPSAGGASSSGFGSLGLNSGVQASPQQVQQQQQFLSQQNPGTTTGFSISSDQGGSVPIAGAGNVLGGSNQPGGASSDQQGSAGGTGSTQTGPFGTSLTGQGNTQFGGGAIVGVASTNKEKTIRIYNKKKTYDEWQFIYNPAMDQQNVLLRGPYQPTTIGNTNIGTPASQLNGQQGQQGQQNSPFGQQNSGFGQQNSGFGQQQPQQQQQPFQNNYPPDQNQQH